MTKRFLPMVCASTLLSLAVGCAESSDDGLGADDIQGIAQPSAEPVVTTDVKESSPEKPGKDVVTAPEPLPEDGSYAGPATLVFSEIAAKGEGWLELYNPHDEVISLEGYGLTDSQDDGTPHPKHRFTFPEGWSVEPGGYFLVRLGALASGPSAECLGLPVTECIALDWKVSNGNGESVWWIDREDRVAAKAVYPANAAGTNESWCRPGFEGEEAWTLCEATPGAENKVLNAE